MKIEKINDNQIRCTLTRADLADRQLKLSELAYGTEKARSLFHDMMQQAAFEFGFEADNMPLMIEAIPLTPDSIVLIITKVEDPEELDTRFSKFTGSTGELPSPQSLHTADITGADDILDLFQKLCEDKIKPLSSSAKKSKNASADTKESDSETDTPKTEESKDPDIIRIFTFHDLDDVILASKALNACYTGENTLYKDVQDGYLLVLHQSSCTPEHFNKVCNILSEYAQGKACSSAREAFLLEHGDIVLRDQAIQQLYQLT